MNKEDIATIVAQVTAQVLIAMANPAQTVTQAVTTVATQAPAAAANIYGEAGFVYLSKVKLPALKKAGLAPAGMTVKEALAAGIMDNTRVDPAIATKAPTAGPAYVEASLKSDKQLMRMTKANLIALVRKQNA